MTRALNLLPSTSKTSPIIVRLSGLAQTNDKLAIREMGRQIAEAQGQTSIVEEEEDAEDVSLLSETFCHAQSLSICEAGLVVEGSGTVQGEEVASGMRTDLG